MKEILSHKVRNIIAATVTSATLVAGGLTLEVKTEASAPFAPTPTPVRPLGWQGIHFPEYNPLPWSDIANPPVLNAIHGVNSETGVKAWAVGEKGAVVHYDGTGWELDHRLESQPDGRTLNLQDVFVTNPDSVWAVGNIVNPDTNAREGVLAHLDQNQWETATKEDLGTNSLSPLNSIHLVNESEKITGWAVGETPANRNQAEILRFMAGNWSVYMGTNNNDTLYDVFTLSQDKAWAVGERGRETRYIGEPRGWPAGHQGPPLPRLALSMTDPLYGWSVGSQGRMFEYIGGCENPDLNCWWENHFQATIGLDGNPVTNNINDVQLLLRNMGWLVGNKLPEQRGNKSLVAFFDGEEQPGRYFWYQVEIENDPQRDLQGIFMSSPYFGFAVGAEGTILKFEVEPPPTATATETAENTPAPSETPTQESTPTNEPSATAPPTNTNTPTATDTPVPTDTETGTPPPTASASFTPSPQPSATRRNPSNIFLPDILNRLWP